MDIDPNKFSYIGKGAFLLRTIEGKDWDVKDTQFYYQKKTS